MQHTPGPWNKEIARASDGIEIGNRDVWIAFVFNDHPDLDCEANANLIKAAPNLLKVAEQALSLCKSFGWHELQDFRTETIVVNALQAAIAEAKGIE